jgi:hypothetical protein
MTVQGESAVRPPAHRPDARRRPASKGHSFILPKNTSAGGFRTLGMFGAGVVR